LVFGSQQEKEAPRKHTIERSIEESRSLDRFAGHGRMGKISPEGRHEGWCGINRENVQLFGHQNLRDGKSGTASEIHHSGPSRQRSGPLPHFIRADGSRTTPATVGQKLRGHTFVSIRWVHHALTVSERRTKDDYLRAKISKTASDLSIGGRMFPFHRLFTILTLGALSIFAPCSSSAASPFPLQYTALLGEGAAIQSVAVDSTGSLYVAGFAGSSLAVTPGAYQTAYNPATCTAQDGMVTLPCPMAFAAKLSADGTSLAYLTYLGMQTSRAVGISVDAQGNAWINGWVSSSDLAVTSGAIQTTPSGQFILKLNPTGSQILYASYFGATGNGTLSQAIDSNGDLYLAGFATAGGVPVSSGAFQTDPGQPAGNSQSDVPFVSKIDPTGKLVYCTYFHGTSGSSTYLNGIAADSSGSAYLTGTTSGGTFPVTAGAFQTSASVASAYVAKLDPTGSKLIYCTYLSGNTASGGAAIGVDSQGNAYVTGGITPNTGLQPTTFPVTPGAFETTAPIVPSQWNTSFGYVAKLNATGSALVYSTLVYASLWVTPQALAVDSAGSAIVIGSTGALDFPTTSGALLQCEPASTAAFLFKLAADGSQPAYSTYFPSDSSLAITVDAAGAIYFAGANSLPVVPGSFGWTDDAGASMVAKLIPEPVPSGSISCITSAANGAFHGTANTVAPGEIVNILGNGIGPAQTLTALTASGQIPTSLGGVQVLFNETPAPILSAGPNQIQVVVPFEAGSASLNWFAYSAEVDILNAAAAVEPSSVLVTPAVPAVYTSGTASLQALMINQDGTLNSAQDPAPQGSIVTVYATGLNNTQPALETGEIVKTAAPLALAGQIDLSSDLSAVNITYAGAAPGMVAGLAQINFQVPVSTTHGFTALELALSQVGAMSQPVYFYQQ
jgi:uncharacterized protein (TIGR03437 family)